ncbi:MAG: rhodanese-like domain-containing protein [Nitrospinae bacterium]|nr:rhodanese-like domain-containing protein [Nitrospinota bacterium]MBI3813135.1 rhodanese-like domain-containing protein [Nitrospinota bacterium]
MLRRNWLKIKLVLSTLIALFYATAYAQFINISVQQAKKMIDAKDYGLILDVRTKEEFVGDLGHIEGAVLIPVQELNGRVAEIEKYKDKKVLVVCHSGVRSRKASDFLTQKGFGNIYNVVDGMLGWNSQKYPVRTKEKD